MEKIKTITGINLLVLLGAMVLANVAAYSGEEGFGPLLFAAMFICFQVAINLVVAIIFFFQRDPRAKQFLLSSVLVLVIGFSVCWGSMSLV